MRAAPRIATRVRQRSYRIAATALRGSPRITRAKVARAQRVEIDHAQAARDSAADTGIRRAADSDEPGLNTDPPGAHRLAT
jgi:hypothetical protein